MNLNNGETTCKTFSGANGEKEHFLFIKAPGSGAFEDQLKAVEERYAAAQSSLGLPPGSAVFRRVFLSDVLNQEALVRQSALADPADPVALSIVQQPPLPGGRIALLAYHVQGRAPLSKRRLSPNHVLIEKNGLGHLWSAGLCAGGGAASAEAQTRAVFAGLTGALESQGGSLEKHCVRTWIYLKNVDVFYQGMVDARRELFARQGLTADTHYIASTGIEGACGGRLDLVGLDAYSVLGLDPRQVSYLNAFDRLCPTKDYNVTFERGTRVAYADRAHHFISGTASIDAGGGILHPGDALRQLERALENIEALLKSGKAGMADLAHLIVYLRDPADLPRVGAYLANNFRDLPLAAVRGAVCRPGWLVEVEGLAVTPNDEPALPSF
ncbi:MAG: hypothetical protein A2X35_11185 [Elusimicrobia bacterium GWA2_61_42]|nr:MAG: hypothetical protein A2X35_11185 [Elusimicrobia bacterium GWA2_61_42]OGR75895.1 MAG: hypothetical protein A2X38_07730 [Elusimicrobia bacterium GWC2_61_25]